MDVYETQRPLEALDIDLDQYTVHYIRVSGYSNTPLIKYYYGIYRVIMKAVPSAASVALTYAQNMLNIPHADKQTFTVMDRFGNVIDDVSPVTYPFSFEGATFVRRSVDDPLPIRLPVL